MGWCGRVWFQKFREVARAVGSRKALEFLVPLHTHPFRPGSLTDSWSRWGGLSAGGSWSCRDTLRNDPHQSFMNLLVFHPAGWKAMRESGSSGSCGVFGSGSSLWSIET